jgi:hypothetical protein
MLKRAAAAVLAASIALPVSAQTPARPLVNPSSAARTGTATREAMGNPADNRGTSSPRDSVTPDIGGMRASRIVGSSVYNDHNEKIGSVDDVVIGNDKSLSVVISVGGFLGLGSKMVQVPFNRLEFGDSKGDPNDRVVMPGASKNGLSAMPDYHYAIHG